MRPSCASRPPGQRGPHPLLRPPFVSLPNCFLSALRTAALAHDAEKPDVHAHTLLFERLHILSSSSFISPVASTRCLQNRRPVLTSPSLTCVRSSLSKPPHRSPSSPCSSAPEPLATYLFHALLSRAPVPSPLSSEVSILPVASSPHLSLVYPALASD